MPLTIEDVDAFATSLPGVAVAPRHGNRTWNVGGNVFAWHRKFSKADLARFGDETPPAGDILALRVESLDAKDALLAIAPPGFFTIPHFNGYAAVLVQLKKAKAKDVRAAIVDAHRCMTPAVKNVKNKRRRG